MGNSNLCPHSVSHVKKKPSEPQVRFPEVLKQIGHSSAESVILPSICDEPSLERVNRITLEQTSDSILDFYKTEKFICNYKATAKKYKVTRGVLKTVSDFICMLRKYTFDICMDLCKDTYEMESSFLAKFTEVSETKDPDNIIPVKDRAIIHYFQVLEVHAMIVEDFMTNNHRSYSLLQQIVISHALMGVSPEYFIILNVNLARYWRHKKILDENTMNAIIIYFSNLTNYMMKVYEYQDGRNSMIRSLLTHEELDDRRNKARNNYRLMKEWKVVIVNLQSRYDEAKQIIAASQFMNRSRDTDKLIVVQSFKGAEDLMEAGLARRKILTKRRSTILLAAFSSHEDLSKH